MKTSLFPMREQNIENIAINAMSNKDLFSELLRNIRSKNDKIRSQSFQVLLLISEKKPELLYQQWTFIVDLLHSENSYHKYMAIYLIASLIVVDKQNKFEDVFEYYYDLLDDKSVIPPSHVAANSGKIVKAKPHLQTMVTNRLLAIDTTHHSLGRKDLIKSYIIDAFDDYFEESEEKEKIILFVKNQLNSSSPKTRKKATKFLEKWQV
jgi:hypothetical protein